MDPTREIWRNQLPEAALGSGLPIVDAHHHLVPVPHRARLESYTYGDIVADLADGGHRIVATVHVDAFSNYRADGPEHLRVVGETEHVSAIADCAVPDLGIFAAIVGNADLMLGTAVGEVLDAHLAASPRLRGARRMTIYDPDLVAVLPGHVAPGLLLTPAFHAGMREVATRALSFDAAVVQSQLPELVALARAFPSVPIVLGHIGTPLAVGRFAGRAAEAFSQWHAGMAALSTCANVTVKIGGLNMPFTGLGAPPDALLPFTSRQMAERQGDHVHATIDLFGPARCMFESNFPVDKWYTSHTVLWNSFVRLAERYTPAERNALFSGTAGAVYGIDVAPPADFVRGGTASEARGRAA